MGTPHKSDPGRAGLTATDLAPRTLGGCRILVVESDDDAAATLTALLRLNGFDAQAALTGASALKAVTPGLAAVVMDLDLPDGDGCDVIRRIRAKANPPAVIVLTGHTDAGHRRAAAEAGAVEYLLKPTSPAELVRLLHRVCPPGPANHSDQPPLRS